MKSTGPSRTKPPLAREPPPSRNWEHEDGPSRAATIIDVDADDDLKPNFSSSQDHQSSDQLDLIARPDDRAGTRASKYEFRQQPRLVPQGEATKAMQEEFDSIESFSEGEYDLDLLNSKLSEGGVKGKVRAFEAMNHVQGPKLNLVQRMKAKVWCPRTFQSIATDHTASLAKQECPTKVREYREARTQYSRRSFDEFNTLHKLEDRRHCP